MRPKHSYFISGYGNSSHRKVTEDYAQENINIGMLELLKHTGRDKAVWIGTSASRHITSILPIY